LVRFAVRVKERKIEEFTVTQGGREKCGVDRESGIIDGRE
jgi:hypothetical protein